jgi:wyosine [tRNA(Phe)-imidazoG37] synthetase (radical SAM superfamily)
VNMNDQRSLVYGPVPSRRLGRSLGLDLVPYKTCSYDCAYCQLGRTTRRTLRRAEYVPVDELIRQMRERPARCERPDYISLAGSGEPTLHSGLGKIIHRIKQVTDIRLALLTNGSLFHDPQVRREAAGADLVLPSLDAGDEEVFKRVNRPAAGLTFEKMLGGLVNFREEYVGPIWLEVMLVGGINDDPLSLERIRAAALKAKPDRIQLNTVTRVPAETSALRIPLDELQRIRDFFGERAEIIADYPAGEIKVESAVNEMEIMEMLARRPCSLEDIASGLRINRMVVAKELDRLEAEQKIVRTEWAGRLLYSARR